MMDTGLSKIHNLITALSISAMFLLTSCLPTATTSKIDSSSATTSGSNSGNTSYQEPTYPLTGTFIQEGTNRSSSSISIPISFTDSFLIRGDTLSKYLRTLDSSAKFCLVGKYTYLSGYNKFLIMSAKARSYTDLTKKTTEYYLQIEPSNDAANQNDCVSYNLNSVLYANVSNPSSSFSFTQLCADCTTAVTSGRLKLYFVNGQEVSTVPVSNLTLSLSGGTGSSANGCVESTTCQARGFDCCLQTQCVNDGALKPGAINLDGFASAQEDVRLNPNRFIVYPQYYYVCDSRPGNGGSGNGGQTDPDYQASIRMLELKQLHDCLNKVDGEFSYCTLKFTGASSSIPGIFAASDSGYNDDVNFSTLNSNLGTGDYANNIVKIIYGGQTLYEQNKTALNGGTFVAATANDNLTSSQKVNITATLSSSAQDAYLYLTYKVDGTCSKVSSSVSKCTKSYIQSHSDTKSTLWHDGSYTYYLPAYADLASNYGVSVKVSDIAVPEDSATWAKFQSPNRIVFSGSYPIFQNQKVEITYYVTSGATDLIKLKSDAQSKVNTMCSCATGMNCNLKAVMNSDNTVVSTYDCSYTSTTPTTPPANQTVYVSNKNTAHRYYDVNGVNYDEDYSGAPDQEASLGGRAFTYNDNDLLKPNNTSAYVGFNEIYGSYAKSGTYLAKPSKLVKVIKDKVYDISTSTGSFSTCPTCGTDYYSGLQKIFPQSFTGAGGGYIPDIYNSSRVNSTGAYRADDLLFGRACFVPATMIPWTHTTSSTVRDQRRVRLAGQHFLFANGYNRDWFGFDYGSLIGSFDGVNWFSVGNLRRIKASSSKLFLAVNSYAGDLSVDSNFTVNVSESSAFSSDVPDHDTESDGAQCQKSHFCSTDNDCFRQVGYDYACQNVSSLSTSWPQFDANGSEIIGSTSLSLASIVGGTNGQTKRCVYRARGAPCLQNLDLASTGSHFNGSSNIGALSCSANTSCLSVSASSSFNDRISRFGNTPTAQNDAAITPLSDTVGLGARILLRPFNFYGTQSIPSSAQISLSNNKVYGLCVPGKDIDSALDNYDLNARTPSYRVDSADKLFGVGRTSSSAVSIRSLNACPATDAAGNSMQIYDLLLGDPSFNTFSISQNLSSNLLDIAPLRSQNIFSSTAGSQITTIGYQRNTCLRAPGASCFSDLECAPSSVISSKVMATNLSAYLNSAEIKFWEEELVCGNPDFKYITPGTLNPTFDLKKNLCCREMGKTLTVSTQTNSSTHQWCDTAGNILVAGVNTSISSPSRYSRVHTVYDKMTCNTAEISSTKSFALSLSSPSPNERMIQILGQYKTLDTLNQRTCCTGHWVRNFAADNGGGHNFGTAKVQTIDKAMFKHLSWGPDTVGVTDDPFECDPNNYTNASCEIKNLSTAEEEKYLTWAASLELIGIPQVAIKTNDQIYKLVGDSQEAIAAGTPLTDSDNKKIFLESNTAPDFIDGLNYRYYSAANYSGMNMTSGTKNSMKKVFSENEFNCCIPSGQQVPTTTSSDQCCTGNKATVNSVSRCCLPDFTDLTLYLNRYVSSEGRGLSDSAYDASTGYIKDASQVRLLASQKNLCCSGTMMTGVAISKLPIPLTGGSYNPITSTSTTRRFNYRSDSVDNNTESGSVGSTFDAGVRWNNHVYCVPSGYAQ
jgi:hypothetical protein